jgi:hypothetical protein
MSNDLVAEKVVVDPVLRAAALFASEHAAVEFACGV